MWILMLVLITFLIIAYVLSRRKLIIGGVETPTELYVVRHGETDVNVQQRANVKDQPEPINANGIDQAKKTAVYLKSRIFHPRIYASPALRAQQTAKIIQKQFPGVKIITDKRLSEIDSGQFAGHNRDTNPELFDRYKSLRTEFDKDRDIIDKALDFPKFDNKVHKEFGTELFSDVVNRLDSFFKDLKPGENIIVTHSGIIASIIEYLTGIHNVPNGDLSKGKNCSVMYIRDNKIRTLPNTLHL